MQVKVIKKGVGVKAFILKYLYNMIMHGKAVSVLAEENSLRWAGEEKGLMAHKDFLVCSVMKLFIKN